MVHGSAVVAALAGGGLALWLWRSIRRSTRSPHSAAPLLFSSTETHRLSSAEGAKYKLLVSLPLSYHRNPQATYPVIYVLDAEPYLFPLITTVARTDHFFARSYYYPDFIVVGITADLEPVAGMRPENVKPLWDGLRPTRARDYLPTAAESPWGGPGAASLLHVSCHASTFTRFVAASLVPYATQWTPRNASHTLARHSTWSHRTRFLPLSADRQPTARPIRPTRTVTRHIHIRTVKYNLYTRGRYVDEHFRTVASQRALVGKSFGGSGVAHALLQRETAQLFSHFMLCSPSLAWDDGAFFRQVL